MVVVVVWVCNGSTGGSSVGGDTSSGGFSCR